MRRRRSLSPVLALAVLLALPLAAQPPDAADPAPTVVLKAAHLFDGVSGRLVDDGVVVVRGDTITAVGPDAPVPPDARVIDLGDATLLPGFIDAHVHLTMEMSDDWYKDFYEETFCLPRRAGPLRRRLRQADARGGLHHGAQRRRLDYVDIGLRNAIDAEHRRGAAHADRRPRHRLDRRPRRPGARSRPTWSRRSARSTASATARRSAARRCATRSSIGADVIKFMPSGGVLSRSDPVDVPELSQEEMDAIVSEAHAWHRKVAAHCHGDEAAKMAIRAGVDSIEHGTFLNDDTLRADEAEGRLPGADALRRLVGRPEGGRLPAGDRREGARRRGADADDVPARGEDRRHRSPSAPTPASSRTASTPKSSP